MNTSISINRTTFSLSVFQAAIDDKMFMGVAHLTRRLPPFPLWRKEVVLMSDYEILIVVFTVIALIVKLLIEYIKK